MQLVVPENIIKLEKQLVMRVGLHLLPDLEVEAAVSLA